MTAAAPGEPGGIRVAYDLRGIQTPYFPERGIARYVHHHVEALADRPEIQSLHGLVEPERPLPAVAARLATRAGGVLGWRDAARLRGAGGPLVHHVGSPFELDWTMGEMLPRSMRAPDVLRVVTLYDVIPLVHPEVHPDWLARRWRARAEMIRSADLVLAISEFTAEDGIRRLGLDERRVRTVGTGVPDVHPAAVEASREPPQVAGLLPDFVLYTGGSEHPRKNLPALVRAYAALAPELRARHQLVIACRMTDAVRDQLITQAVLAGVPDRIVLPGYVTDETLRRLFLSCRLFVYPSTYEGFGLPVVEAMSHDAPVVHSGTTSVAEVGVDERATFDPADEGAITAAMTRVLSDDALSRELAEKGREAARLHNWPAVAERTVRAYEEALARRPARRRAPRGASGRVTFATLTYPTVGSPAGAMVVLAGAVSRRSRVLLSAPGKLRPRGARAAAIAPGELRRTLDWADGDLVVLVDSPDAAAWGASLMAGRGGTALVWEPDLVLTPAGAAPELAALAAVATRFVVASRLDQLRLRLALGAASPAMVVLPPPLSLGPAGGDVGHELPFEALVMTNPGRKAVRAGRGVRLLIAPRPARFGPFTEAELSRAEAVAADLGRRGREARLVLLGDTDPDMVVDLQRRAMDLGGGGLLTWAPWPAYQEALAWGTAADAVVGLTDGPPSLVAAVVDQALCLRLPAVVMAAAGASAPSVRRLTPSATPAEIADAASALLGIAEDADDGGLLAARSPEALAGALLDLLAGHPAHPASAAGA